MTIEPRYLTGQFLLAMPGIADARFRQAVIAVCSHDTEGALGLGVGTVIDGLTLHDLLRQLEIPPGVAPDTEVFFGGPVETRRGFVLHSRDWGGQDTLDVAGKWGLSGTLDVLRAIAGGTGPRDWVVALGYAGWGPGQLEQEMAGPGWLSVEDGDAMLFETPPDRRWLHGFERAGIDPRLMSSESGTA